MQDRPKPLISATSYPYRQPMKNLFILLWKNNFTLLFLLFFSLSIYLVILNNNFQQVAFLNSTNRITASVLSVVNSVNSYLDLREKNADLANENAFLKSILPENFYDLNNSLKTINDSLLKQQYTFLEARVVSNSVNRRSNYLTLNKGSIHGVMKDMGVISSRGVVGIVKDVSPHYCTVMSLLHKNSRISTRFSRSRYFGSLVWEGMNSREATLLDVARHVKFGRGDTLVTTTFSAVFPEGIIVGTVKESEVRKGDNFFRITVSLSVNFSNLSHVYIVNNLLKEEQQSLEAATMGSDD